MSGLPKLACHHLRRFAWRFHDALWVHQRKVLLHERASSRHQLLTESSRHISIGCLLVQGKIAKWWIPDDVVFVKEIPHTATGKVSKLTLRRQLKGYQSSHSKL